MLDGQGELGTPPPSRLPECGLLQGRRQWVPSRESGGREEEDKVGTPAPGLPKGGDTPSHEGPGLLSDRMTGLEPRVPLSV